MFALVAVFEVVFGPSYSFKNCIILKVAFPEVVNLYTSFQKLCISVLTKKRSMLNSEFTGFMQAAYTCVHGVVSLQDARTQFVLRQVLVATRAFTAQGQCLHATSVITILNSEFNM